MTTFTRDSQFPVVLKTLFVLITVIVLSTSLLAISQEYKELVGRGGKADPPPVESLMVDLTEGRDIKSVDPDKILLPIGDSSDTSTNESGVNQGGSESISRSGGESQRTVELLYSISGDTMPSKMIPIGQPITMVESGFYIWLDGVGNWNCRIITNQSSEVVGTVKCDGIIDLIRSDFWTALSADSLQLHLGSMKGRPTRGGNVIFQVNGRLIEFDLSMNQSNQCSLVFIGRDSINPKRVPFKIRVQSELLQR